MRLAGRVFDFGDRPLADHLRAIAVEIAQAFLNGEDASEGRQYQALHDLSRLLLRLAARAEGA